MRSDLRPLLTAARAGGYAIGCCTVVDMASARGVLEAIEMTDRAAAVGITRRMTPYMDFEGLAAYLVRRIEELAIPVGIHLDHANDLDLVRRALDSGFTSVQYDAVGLPFEEKVARTREGAEMAHGYGATFEAELEHIGRTGVEDGEGLTQPDVAVRFAEETGLDVLAVSIGTVHGLARGEARIDLDLLDQLVAVVPAFLSLHGGTGAARADLGASIRHGIVKVSYFHGMAEAAVERLKVALDEQPHGMLTTILDEVRPAFRDRAFELLSLVGDPAGTP
jgi:fructose-bisphosphate aldolase, class II